MRGLVAQDCGDAADFLGIELEIVEALLAVAAMFQVAYQVLDDLLPRHEMICNARRVGGIGRNAADEFR
jgi:hypothetical protein